MAWRWPGGSPDGSYARRGPAGRARRPAAPCGGLSGPLRWPTPAGQSPPEHRDPDPPPQRRPGPTVRRCSQGRINRVSRGSEGLLAGQGMVRHGEDHARPGQPRSPNQVGTRSWWSGALRHRQACLLGSVTCQPVPHRDGPAGNGASAVVVDTATSPTLHPLQRPLAAPLGPYSTPRCRPTRPPVPPRLPARLQRAHRRAARAWASGAPRQAGPGTAGVGLVLAPDRHGGPQLQGVPNVRYTRASSSAGRLSGRRRLRRPRAGLGGPGDPQAG